MGLSRLDNANIEMMEAKIDELERSKEKLEQEVFRLASNPFNQGKGARN